MAERRLVLDANILIRAVLGTRVRKLIERHSAAVAMIAPDAAFADLDRYMPEIFAKRGLSPAAALPVIERLRAAVYELSVAAYADRESDARARIGIRDMDDWPVVASALVLDCPIWTEDRDFFGSGVPTWTTDRVELYLVG